MEPIVITLKHPIEIGDEKVEKLTIKRRATAKDLRCMDQEKGEIAKSAALLARLAEVPVRWVDQMDAADFTVAAEVVGSFLS